MAYEQLNAFVDKQIARYNKNPSWIIMEILNDFYFTVLAPGKFSSQRRYLADKIGEIEPKWKDALIAKKSKTKKS